MKKYYKITEQQFIELEHSINLIVDKLTPSDKAMVYKILLTAQLEGNLPADIYNAIYHLLTKYFHISKRNMNNSIDVNNESSKVNNIELEKFDFNDKWNIIIDLCKMMTLRKVICRQNSKNEFLSQQHKKMRGI